MSDSGTATLVFAMALLCLVVGISAAIFVLWLWVKRGDIEL